VSESERNTEVDNELDSKVEIVVYSVVDNLVNRVVESMVDIVEVSVGGHVWRKVKWKMSSVVKTPIQVN
jgi:hypothetical protein